METKSFRVITSLAMVLALTAAILSIIGIVITGFYPGVIVLALVALVAVSSRYYGKKITGRSNNYRGNYFTAFTIINLLVIFVVLWMAFVIVIDRVFPNI